MSDHVDLSICTDCLMLEANGETPPDFDEATTVEYLDRVTRASEGGHVALGGEHQGFSWSSCDLCGSGLGGDRYAATLFLD